MKLSLCLSQNYDTLHDLPTEQTGDNDKLSLENASPADIPWLKDNLMLPPELTLNKEMICSAKIYYST